MWEWLTVPPPTITKRNHCQAGMSPQAAATKQPAQQVTGITDWCHCHFLIRDSVILPTYQEKPGKNCNPQKVEIRPSFSMSVRLPGHPPREPSASHPGAGWSSEASSRGSHRDAPDDRQQEGSDSPRMFTLRSYSPPAFSPITCSIPSLWVARTSFLFREKLTGREESGAEKFSRKGFDLEKK